MACAHDDDESRARGDGRKHMLAGSRDDMQTTTENTTATGETTALTAGQLAGRVGGSLRHVWRKDWAGKLPAPVGLAAAVRLWEQHTRGLGRQQAPHRRALDQEGR